MKHAIAIAYDSINFNYEKANHIMKKMYFEVEISTCSFCF